jgi:hypothetical protein
MRNSKTIPINQRLSCTAFELSVSQVLSVLWLMDDYEYPTQLLEFAVANADNLLMKARDVLVFNKPTEFLKLANPEAEKVTDLFFDINRAFFKGENKKQSEFITPVSTDTITGSEFYEELSSNVEVLTRFGHTNVLDYPFSYFLIVLDNFNEAHSGE